MPRSADIDVDELAKRLNDGARLIDVREADEYQSGHVPGAENWPLSELPASFSAIGSDETLLVIGRLGGRSANAGEFLVGHGYSVVNVEGGTMAWAMAGRDLVTGDQPT